MTRSENVWFALPQRASEHAATKRNLQTAVATGQPQQQQQKQHQEHQPNHNKTLSLLVSLLFPAPALPLSLSPPIRTYIYTYIRDIDIILNSNTSHPPKMSTPATTLFSNCTVDFENQRHTHQSLIWFFVLVPSLVVVLMRHGSCFYPYSQLLFDRAPIPFDADERHARLFLQTVLGTFTVGCVGIAGVLVLAQPRCSCGAVSQCNVCRVDVVGLVDLGRCHAVLSYLAILVAVIYLYNMRRVWKILQRTRDDNRNNSLGGGAAYAPVALDVNDESTGYRQGDNDDDDYYDDNGGAAIDQGRDSEQGNVEFAVRPGRGRQPRGGEIAMT